MNEGRGWVLWAIIAVGMGAQAMAEAERVLPLWSSRAGNQERPLPFGVSAVAYEQDHGYDVTGLRASSAVNPMVGQMIGMVDTATIDVDNQVRQIGLMADAWLLPFLNVYTLLGYIEGNTKVRFGALPAEIAPLLNNIDYEYSGVVYGAGGTVAWGVDPFFAAIDGVMTWTDLTDGASVKAVVLRPIVGLKHHRLTLWTGAMFQDATEEHKGQFALPMLGPVDYDLRLTEKEPWNWLIGTSYAFNRNWSLKLELGLGERRQVETMLTYRF